jgi:hypothetical protein
MNPEPPTPEIQSPVNPMQVLVDWEAAVKGRQAIVVLGNRECVLTLHLAPRELSRAAQGILLVVRQMVRQRPLHQAADCVGPGQFPSRTVVLRGNPVHVRHVGYAIEASARHFEDALQAALDEVPPVNLPELEPENQGLGFL